MKKPLIGSLRLVPTSRWVSLVAARELPHYRIGLPGKRGRENLTDSVAETLELRDGDELAASCKGSCSLTVVPRHARILSRVNRATRAA